MAQLYGAAEQPSWEAAGLGSIPLLLITVCECTGKLIPTEDHIESYSQISILLGFQLSLGPLGPPPCLHNFPARREYMKNFSASLWHSFTSRASSPITFLAGLQLTPTKNEILGQQSHRFSSFLQPAKPQVHTHTHTRLCQMESVLSGIEVLVFMASPTLSWLIELAEGTEQLRARRPHTPAALVQNPAGFQE